MIVPPPDWQPFDPDGAEPWFEPVACDGCGRIVYWLPGLGDMVDADTTSPHECQP